MLAGFDAERIGRIVDRHGVPPRTDRTTTGRGELAAELDSIADRGYGIDWNEQVVGMGVAAAPIVADERAVGSIGVVRPIDKLYHTTCRAELVAAVQQSANVVSANYQYSP